MLEVKIVTRSVFSFFKLKSVLLLAASQDPVTACMTFYLYQSLNPEVAMAFVVSKH